MVLVSVCVSVQKDLVRLKEHYPEEASRRILLYKETMLKPLEVGQSQVCHAF